VDIEALLNQVLNDMTADKTGSSRDDDFSDGSSASKKSLD